MKTDQEQDAEFIDETGCEVDITLPESGVIAKYHAYAEPQTEAPSIYHTYMGMSLVASVLGRKVYFGGSGEPRTYPNMYIILLGASSTVKKSTTLNIAKRIISRVNENLILPNEFSIESLLYNLNIQPQGTFFWSEFGGILANFERSYMSGAKQLITDLYDCPPSLKKSLMSIEKDPITGKREMTIRDSCINIATATTLEWLIEEIKERDIRSGFLARFLFIPGAKTSKILPFSPPPDDDLGMEIINDLTNIGNLSGEATFSKEAHAEYSDWYTEKFKDMEENPNGNNLGPFASRLLVYAKKFAIIYQISENQSLVVDGDNMHRACQAADWLGRNATNMINNQLVFGTDAIILKKTHEVIKAEKNGIPKNILSRRVNIRADILTKIIATLEQQEYIWSKTVKNSSGAGRPITMYFAK
jgi:hypothetical protein